MIGQNKLTFIPQKHKEKMDRIPANVLSCYLSGFDIFQLKNLSSNLRKAYGPIFDEIMQKYPIDLIRDFMKEGFYFLAGRVASFFNIRAFNLCDVMPVKYCGSPKTQKDKLCFILFAKKNQTVNYKLLKFIYFKCGRDVFFTFVNSVTIMQVDIISELAFKVGGDVTPFDKLISSINPKFPNLTSLFKAAKDLKFSDIKSHQHYYLFKKMVYTVFDTPSIFKTTSRETFNLIFEDHCYRLWKMAIKKQRLDFLEKMDLLYKDEWHCLANASYFTKHIKPNTPIWKHHCDNPKIQIWLLESADIDTYLFKYIHQVNPALVKEWRRDVIDAEKYAFICNIPNLFPFKSVDYSRFLNSHFQFQMGYENVVAFFETLKTEEKLGFLKQFIQNTWIYYQDIKTITFLLCAIKKENFCLPEFDLLLWLRFRIRKFHDLIDINSPQILEEARILVKDLHCSLTNSSTPNPSLSTTLGKVLHLFELQIKSLVKVYMVFF